MIQTVRINKLCDKLNISRATYYRIKDDTDFPKAIRLSKRIISYDVKEVDNYINNLKCGNECGNENA